MSTYEGGTTQCTDCGTDIPDDMDKDINGQQCATCLADIKGTTTMGRNNNTRAVTATFRDYSTTAGDHFMLDTDHAGMASLVFVVLEKRHPEENGTYYRVGAVIGRDTARELGTDLLGWVHSGITSTSEDVYYETLNGSQLFASCVDSICELFIKDSVIEPIAFEMNTDVTIDLAQRLIVFAGVNVNAKMEV